MKDSKCLYEIEFIYKGMPYRRLADNVAEMEAEISRFTEKGGIVVKIIKW